MLAIADAWSDDFLGSIVLFDIHESDAEVGFWLAPQGRGRGAARQGLSAVAGLATEAGLTRLTARTAPENVGSRRVLERVGFVLAGGPRDGSRHLAKRRRSSHTGTTLRSTQCGRSRCGGAGSVTWSSRCWTTTTRSPSTTRCSAGSDTAASRR
ncbi:GNAT family N-acetyltransferase [Mycolicibacterium sp. XJ1904]